MKPGLEREGDLASGALPPSTPEDDYDLSPVAHAAGAGRLGAFYQLTKPGIAGFVTLTSGAGFFVASGGHAPLVPLLHTMFGTLLSTSGALALNQYLERAFDAVMRRTRGRPLPSGRVAPAESLLFGLLLLAAGAGHLWFWIGPLPAALTLVSAAAYTLVYTPLKRRSYLATLVGAIPGAMPVLIGWSASAGEISPGALTLFFIFFLWQLPHVLALAWLCRDDYALVGFLMAPPADPEGRVLGMHMLLSAAALIPVSIFPTLLGLTGWIYFGGALVLGSVLFMLAVLAARAMTRETARRVFFGTLVYHPSLLVLLLVDTVRL